MKISTREQYLQCLKLEWSINNSTTLSYTANTILPGQLAWGKLSDHSVLAENPLCQGNWPLTSQQGQQSERKYSKQLTGNIPNCHIIPNWGF